MEDLKSIVIQSLEQEGTLSALKAQLRSRVFQAIEQNADARTKQSAGFQWQNPNVEKIHGDEDALLVAHLIREYFDHYKMDYAKSVYIPEASLEQAKDLKVSQTKNDLLKRVNMEGSTENDSILVQMTKQIRAQQEQMKIMAAQLEKLQLSSQVNHAQLKREKNLSQQSSHSQVSREGTPSPLMQQQQQLHQQYKQQQKDPQADARSNKFSNNAGEDDTGIQEEIIDEVDDLNNLGQNPLRNKAGDPLTSSDNIGASAISSSGANAIDHSIDTLQLEQYDYIEEVKLN